MILRRNLLLGILAAGAAPAIVRPASLMRIAVLPPGEIVLPPWLYVEQTFKLDAKGRAIGLEGMWGSAYIGGVAPGHLEWRRVEWRAPLGA
jgi:hypothetical protein